ncbi:MAG: type II 3-dehydroquinate dehydratase [Bacteroidales bacterium]|nr:type II 3-dehydroquinate dehydratase [Bacteroidales bacterium]
MKIQIINGANLNLLGTREPYIYGNQSFETFFEQLKIQYSSIELYYFQSNNEADIIEKIHQVQQYDGLIINGGAYSHTSIAIADALRSVAVPHIVEVHISNVFNREDFRKKSYIAQACSGSICGLGLDGYRLAIEHIIHCCCANK